MLLGCLFRDLEVNSPTFNNFVDPKVSFIRFYTVLG